MAKPLRGVRMLDLTHMLSGPYAGMILADLGAETIKVEPLHGEGTRKLLASDPKHSLSGMGAYFITLNRNKQSVCVDLKSEQGLSVFYALVKRSDVVLNNFSAGVPERLKIDHAQLSQINPRIITCSITGFGSSGPDCRRPAFDQVTQAVGGGMSITGLDRDHPVRSGVPIGDLGGGLFGVIGVLAALVERQTSGVGQDVDISMQDGQISLLNYMATMHFLSGEDPEPIGNAHFVHVPYNTYPTADGHLVIAVITDNFWQNLKTVVACPDFDDPRYDTQPARLADQEMIDRRLAEALATDTTAAWLAKLRKQRIPCAPVNRFSEALNDPQVRHRDMVVELSHPDGSSTWGPGNPVKLSRDDEPTSCAPAPTRGQHTDEVLSGLLGYDPGAIAALRDSGAVA